MVKELRILLDNFERWVDFYMLVFNKDIYREGGSVHLRFNSLL
jgi:hypothetical protein